MTDGLMSEIRAEAGKGAMSIDLGVYVLAGRDPLEPILFAGNLDSPVAFVGRDLGRDEVRLGEPLIGGAGQRVRRALHTHLFGHEGPKRDPYLHVAVNHALLTNTVPYKPEANIAYPPGVRERFRAFIAALLTCRWTGEMIITLGTEAFHWFAPYADPGALASFWTRPDRYEAQFPITLTSNCEGSLICRPVTLAPLPHPSPLNRAYLALFPMLLSKRLLSIPFDP